MSCLVEKIFKLRWSPLSLIGSGNFPHLANIFFLLSRFSYCSGASGADQTLTSMGSNDKVAESIHASMWGMAIGDAVAMPVHWYYNPSDIKRDYKGWLTGFVAPHDTHPSSILNKSAVDGSGRSGSSTTSKPIIGTVILHDKLKYWTQGGNVHYHRGMSAGDNTLNIVLALENMRVMKDVDPDSTMPPDELRKIIMEHYVKFMTTPGSHDDTYAESFHRSIFKDWIQLQDPPRTGEAILEFLQKRYSSVTAENEDHQLPAIGAIPIALPWILHYAGHSADECARNAVEAIKLTHPAPSLMPYIDKYARLLHALLHGADLRTEVLKIAEVLGKRKLKQTIEGVAGESQSSGKSSEDRLRACQDAVSRLGLACYIDGSMPSMLLLAHVFHDSFSEGVLTNANCGGENAHRGAALGALLGAHSVYNKKPIDPKWKTGLHGSNNVLRHLTAPTNQRGKSEL